MLILRFRPIQEKVRSTIHLPDPGGLGAQHREHGQGAERGLLVGMMLWLTEEHGMDRKEAYLHFTANPDVRIHTYQFVGPAFYVIGVEFPKKYL